MNYIPYVHYTPHGTMQVLKQFLANLPEPLLTDAYYQAHCQVLTESTRQSTRETPIVFPPSLKSQAGVWALGAPSDAFLVTFCVQVPLLLKKNISSEEREAAELKQVSCVQLLFQLIPPVHLALLKDLLLFLQVPLCSTVVLHN